MLLKGPTGCGKTRFVEAMAYDLGRELVTVACHEDLTAADLVGRFLIQGGDTVWADGPLTRAVRNGAICYLDEVVEARQDTTVVIHPLSDHRRQLPIDRLGLTLDAAPGFCLVVSSAAGVPLREAAKAAVAGPLADDRSIAKGLHELIDAYLPEP